MTAASELPFSFAVHESARRAVHEVKGQCTRTFSDQPANRRAVERDTPTLVDGPSLTGTAELSGLCPLELLGCDVLQDSYVRLRYGVARPS